jgi:uncharacterized membrane protein
VREGLSVKIAYKLRFVPAIIGFAFAIISFINLAAVSIPYQDPTPAMLQEHARHIELAKLWIAMGMGLVVIGAVYFFVVQSRRAKPGRRNKFPVSK